MVPILVAASIIGAIKLVDEFLDEAVLGKDYLKKRKQKKNFTMVAIHVHGAEERYLSLTDEELKELLEYDLVKRGEYRVRMVNLGATITPS